MAPQPAAPQPVAVPQSVRLTERELHRLTVQNKASFADPRAANFIVQFFIGFGAVFNGWKESFSQGYLGLCILISLMVAPLVFLWVFLSLTFGLIIFFVIWFSIWGLLFGTLVKFIIKREINKISYLIELKQNGSKISTKDFFWGAGKQSGPKFLSGPWFVALFKNLANTIGKVITKLIIKQLYLLLFNLLFAAGQYGSAFIPIVGPWLTTFLFCAQIALNLVLVFFDMICERKGMNILHEILTVWNNFMLFFGIGMGLACTILPIITIPLLMPSAIVAITKIQTRLCAHEHTGFQEPVMYLPFNFGILIGKQADGKRVHIGKFQKLSEMAKASINRDGIGEDIEETMEQDPEGGQQMVQQQSARASFRQESPQPRP